MRAGRSATFFDHVKQALELFNDPVQLGERSPLATPYVLGDALHGREPTAQARGQALAQLIERAAEALWGGPLPLDGAAMLTAAAGDAPDGRYECLILELNYFKQRFRPAPRNQADVYSDFLHISRPTHDRHLRAAIERLCAALLHYLQPAIQLEQPAPPPLLIGRQAAITNVLHDLRAGRTVSLAGPGGVGKTALGAAVVEQWAAARFWYTFRSGLNDQLASLLFALGAFLHRQGASMLWQQLVVERGRITTAGLALGLALADLASLPERPVLCFDEIDLLRPPAGETAPTSGQTQVRELLDGLRGQVPLLLIGQRPLWPGEAYYEPAPFSLPELAAWLDAQSVPYTPADITHLHAYTTGNPRLAELCLALYRSHSDAGFAAVLEQLPSSPALLPLWLRVERGLAPIERRIVQALSVFHFPAPVDAWHGDGEQRAALAELIDRRLVQPDERGGISLLPALRTIVYNELPVEQREELHAAAAQIRAERGAYTAAAYHLEQAGQPEAAIDLWYDQRTQEIEQGQAGAALAIFSRISPRRLPARLSKRLLLLRAELHELAGEPAQITADLSQEAWPADDAATPEAMQRLGQAFDAQGQPERALETYQHGLDAVVALLRQGAQLHVQRSVTNMRRREVAQAWREANLARFHAETTLGIVNEQRGDYAAAAIHYRTALEIAEQFQHQAGTAQLYHYLAMLAGRQQHGEQALGYFAQAIDFYERIGDRVNREIVRSNLASVYIQLRQFQAALDPAEQALRFFTAMGNSARIAQNASNLAEAHAELGNLDEARRYATLVLQQDEPQSHPYALYTLGTVARRSGDLKQAERSYDQARRIAELHDDTYLAAFAWRALGEVARDRRDAAQADQAFAMAVTLFQRLNLPDEIRETERLSAQRDASPADSEA